MMLKFRPTPWRSICANSFVVATLFVVTTLFMAASAEAQIVRDATTGQTPGDLVAVNGVFEIDGAEGIRRGANNEIVIPVRG